MWSTFYPINEVRHVKRNKTLSTNRTEAKVGRVQIGAIGKRLLKVIISFFDCLCGCVDVGVGVGEREREGTKRGMEMKKTKYEKESFCHFRDDDIWSNVGSFDDVSLYHSMTFCSIIL